MTEQAVIEELSQVVIEELSSDELDLWVKVMLIAFILVVLGAAGVATRRSRTLPTSDAVGQA